tara:strand:- start:294 stop:1481 length:1188 start_codon:yes stop_codon:yes gene_type:complete
VIEIQKKENKLVLKYYYSDFQSGYWVDDKLLSSKPFPIKKVFHVRREILIERIEEDFEEPEYLFEIGFLVGHYFKIDKTVFGLKNNFYFHKDLPLSEKHFIAKTKISLLNQIDRLIYQDIFIGGDKEDILPYKAFIELTKIFPTTHEVKLYREAKVTAILRDYFDNVLDREMSYHSYIGKKTPVYKSDLRKTFKDSEIIKHETLLDRLRTMLNNEVRYSEKQWQEEIIQIILMLFPKYIAVFDEVSFKDVYNKKTRKLDYGLIDFMGNLDIIEIKIPFEKSIVTTGKYRDNHIPKRDLSGTIMQIEKYIYYLNKLGVQGEKRLTKKYKEKLPLNLEIKITNPNGMIIMGRDIGMDKNQLTDFEIIKRKYKNIIDIFTYDDLLRRLEITIGQLKQL